MINQSCIKVDEIKKDYANKTCCFFTIIYQIGNIPISDNIIIMSHILNLKVQVFAFDKCRFLRFSLTTKHRFGVKT